MSAIYLFDDAKARTFEPFALTRPCGEMRAGALLIRERWSRALGAAVVGHITSEHLEGFEEPGAAPVLTDGVIPAGAWIANARFAPSLQAAPDTDMLVAHGSTVAFRLQDEIPIRNLAGFGTGSGGYGETVGGRWMDEIWDFVGSLVPMLLEDLPILGVGTSSTLPHGSIRIGEHPVFVEPGAIIEEAVCFDASAGPILISRGAHVHAFTRLVGPLYIGQNSIVTADRIASSSIGDTCKVHGELSNTIFIGHANKGHDGFVGHSILGRWVNLGAGTITSNLKNTYGSVALWTPSGIRDSGLQFLGTMFGDHAKTGIGTRLTTGCVLGAGANVYGSRMPPKAVAPFSWGEAGEFVDFRLDKFLEIAARVMSRRHVTLTDAASAQLRRAYDARWSVAP